MPGAQPHWVWDPFRTCEDNVGMTSCWYFRWMVLWVYVFGVGAGAGKVSQAPTQWLSEAASYLAVLAVYTGIQGWHLCWTGHCYCRSVMSDSLQPHGLQHTRLPYSPPTPRVCSNSRPLSRWCHPTISSSVALFSSCPQSFPSSRPCPMSWFFASGGQSISVSISPFNEYCFEHHSWTYRTCLRDRAGFESKVDTCWLCGIWADDLTSWNFSFCVSPFYEYSGLISLGIDWFDLLAVRGTLKSLLQHDKLMPQFEGIDSSALSLLYGPTFTTVHDYWKIMLLLHYYGNLAEKAVESHSSTLAWKLPWMEEPGGLRSMRSRRVGYDWATSLSLFTFMHWRRKWQPTPVFLPGESQGRRSPMGCRLWGHTELDTTEAT